MTPHLRHAIDVIRSRSALVDRLFGPDAGNGIGTGAWHESTPEPAWCCEWRGHVMVGEDCVYCDGAS